MSYKYIIIFAEIDAKEGAKVQNNRNRKNL